LNDESRFSLALRIIVQVRTVYSRNLLQPNHCVDFDAAREGCMRARPTDPPQSQGVDPRADRLVQLAQATSLCGRELRRALQQWTRDLGLGDSDLLVLWSCARGGAPGVPQNGLADAVGLSPAQTSGLLDRLRQRGLVASRRPPRDRRRQLWRLEPKGLELLTCALGQICALADEVLSGLAVEDQRLLESLLAAVSASARQASPQTQGGAPPGEELPPGEDSACGKEAA
jgi:DNA-binding MarR family transcriptional regulator